MSEHTPITGELRERLAVLDNRRESMHYGGSITDELRDWLQGKDHLQVVTMTRDEWLQGLNHDDQCETVGDILEQIVFDCITHGQDMGPCGMTDETGQDVGMLLTAMLLDQWQQWILDATREVVR